MFLPHFFSTPTIAHNQTLSFFLSVSTLFTNPKPLHTYKLSLAHTYTPSSHLITRTFNDTNNTFEYTHSGSHILPTSAHAILSLTHIHTQCSISHTHTRTMFYLSHTLNVLSLTHTQCCISHTHSIFYLSRTYTRTMFSLFIYHIIHMHIHIHTPQTHHLSTQLRFFLLQLLSFTSLHLTLSLSLVPPPTTIYQAFTQFR